MQSTKSQERKLTELEESAELKHLVRADKVLKQKNLGSKKAGFRRLFL